MCFVQVLAPSLATLVGSADWGLSLTGKSQSEKGLVCEQWPRLSNYFWQHTLSLADFTPFRGDTTPRSPEHCPINVAAFCSLDRKAPCGALVPLSSSSRLVATGWEAKGKRGCFFPVRVISDLGIWGRVFLEEVWQFAWPGGCLSPMNALPRSGEAAVWRGAAITAPCCDGFVTQGSAAPGVCVFVSWNFSVIFLTGVLSDMHSLRRYFHVFIILQASVTFPKSSCWSLRFDHLLKVPAGIIWPFSSDYVDFCSSWYAQFESGFLM